jgi:PAS domain S-box-containing protein
MQSFSLPNGRFSPSVGDALEDERKRLEEALRESEERFRGLFEASPWGLLIHDEGRILDANPTLAMIFGYEISELVGMEAPHLVAPEWRDFTLQRRLAGCEEPYEAVSLKRDGTTFPVQLCGKAVRSNGHVVRMVAVRELTERKRAEEALRQAELRYRFLFEQAPAMYVITRNEDGAPIISDCNKLFLDTLGYARAEFLGQSLAEFYTPESRLQLLEHGGYERALEGRFGVEGRQLLTRDGRVVATVLRAVPEFDDGGRTIGTRAMYLNITDRKRAEEALRESEERFRLIARATSDGIWDWDLVTGAVWWNEGIQKLIGHAPSDPGDAPTDVGANLARWYAHIDAADRDRVMGTLWAVVETGGESWSQEYRVRWADGSCAHALGRGYVIRDMDGKPVRMIGGITDITERKRAEEALAYQAQLLASVNDAIISTDEQFILKSWNPAAERIYGWKAEEVLGRPASGVLRTEFPGAERSAVIGAAVEAGDFHGEVVQYRKDGTAIHVESKVIGLRDGGGHTTGYVGVNRDITERKRAEEALGASEERFRKLCDATIEGIVIHDGRKILDANQALAAMLGYDVSEIVGRDGLEFVAPDYRSLVEQSMLAGYEAPYEVLCVRRDGSTFPAEVRGKVISYDGRLARVTAVRDITKRRRAEEALRESEERFRLIAQATSDAIYDYDLVTGSVWWSEGMRTLFGYARNDVGPGITWWYEHIHSEDRDGVASRTYAATLNREQFWVEEYRFRRSDGSYAYVADRGYFIYDGVGKPLRTIGGLTDITERKRAEEALRESEERFRLIAQATSDAIWDWDLVTGRVWRGDGMLTLFGHTPSETEPRITWWYDRIHPRDKGRIVAGLHAAIQDGREFWHDEYRFRRADASYACIEDCGYVIHDRDGKPVRMIGGMTDVSERKRAEEALRESEERFRQVAEASREWIWEFDAEGRYTYCNPGVKDILGYEAEEVVGRPYCDLFTPGERKRLRPVVMDIFTRKRSFLRVVNEKAHKDGHEVVIESTGRPIIDAEGNMVGYRGVDEDITERIRAEQVLRDSERRYRLLAENVTDVIWTVDLSLRTTYISPSVTRLRGYSVEEAMAQTLEEVVTPASLDLVRQVLAEELAAEGTGQSDPSRSRTLELEHICKGGSTVWAEVRVSALRDESRRLVGFLGVSRDITKRRRAEEALRESERRYRLLAENATDIIATRDLQLRVTYMSPSVTDILGYTVEEAMAKPLEEMLTPASLEVARKAFAEELAAEETGQRDPSRSVTLELENICRDGSTVWLEVRMTALHEEDGRAVGILGVSRDISERRRAQLALEESERRYRLLAENATDIIWITDSNLRAVYINPAVTRIRGFSIEEVLAHTPEEALTPASVEVAKRALAEAMGEIGREDSPRWWTLELEHTCKDGSTVWLETTATALCDEQGRVVQFLGASRDISERKRAEEALQETREELESRVERRMRRGSAYGLTFRELTVLHLVVAGKSDKEIAAVLGISALTASKHMGNILHKMGAGSRTEAGVRAVREGLLD